MLNLDQESPFFSPLSVSSLSYIKLFSSNPQSWRVKDFVLQNHNNLINSEVICCQK